MQKAMRSFVVAVVAIVLSIYLGTIALAQQQPAESTSCSIPFRAAVVAGPSSGTVFEGNLVFEVVPIGLRGHAGELEGQLEMADGTSVPVFGHVAHRSIGLVFELEPRTEESSGSFMFGSGASRNPILGDELCGAAFGGTFAGPQEGDIGDWGNRDDNM